MTTRRGAALDPDEPALQVHGPADLVQLVPYLLGFRPAESLVIIGLARGTVAVTVRIDLADLVADCPPGVLAGTVAAMVGGGAENLVGVVFNDRAVLAAPPWPSGQLPWHGLLAAVSDEAERAGAGLSDMLLVSSGRWWSYCCSEPGCCPPTGVSVDDAGSAVPAAAAYAGLVALPDRAALAALLDPEPAQAGDTLLPRLVAAERLTRTDGDPRRSERLVKRALFAAARQVQEPATRLDLDLDQDDLVRFGAALAGIPVRDAVWLAVDDQRLDGRELWRSLGRRLPGRYAAAPLFLFGWASWRAGNGALAGIAAERALECDPACTAADLLLAALSRGLDPRRLPKLRQRSA